MGSRENVEERFFAPVLFIALMTLFACLVVLCPSFKGSPKSIHRVKVDIDMFSAMIERREIDDDRQNDLSQGKEARW